MAHTFSLSLAALDMLLEQGRLGRAPVPFSVPHIGTSAEQRAQVRAAVYRDLEARGLMAGGRLDPGVEQALRTFVSPPVSISAAAQLDGGTPLFARAGSDGEYAVVVRQDENMLVFTEARPTGIVPMIVDLLPLTPAAPGQSVTVAKPAKRKRNPYGGDEGYNPFSGVAAPRSHSTTQLRMVERIFEKPRRRVGQFTAFVRDQRGHPVDLSPIAWFDTEAGRYLMTIRDGSDGQTWITYAPADNARIAQQLHEQLEGTF